MDDTDEDRRAIQGVLQSILMYPLAEYDGQMKRIDWSTIPRLANPATCDEEVKWVVPEKIFEELAAILADAPPLPGEEARYAQVLAVLDAATSDKAIREAMVDGAKEADELIVKPLLQFRNYGQQLPHHWSTISNESAFGTDYFTRTAVARSNILVNSPNETKYFYQDLDVNGPRLNGRIVTLSRSPRADAAAHGFWSLTLYNEHHFFAPNAINRYSLGTKNKDLQQNPDGSLTIHVQADEPARRTNWPPTTAGEDFSRIWAYWPEVAITVDRGLRRLCSR